jgi:hypothetical protein
MRAVLAFCVALCVSLVVGCGPQAVVLTQASPNPLVGQRTVMLAPTIFAPSIRVAGKAEDAYLADKSPAEVKAWQEAKEAFGARFNAILVQQRLVAATADFTVRPTVKIVEPGFDVYVWNAPAEVEVEVEVLDARGNLVDRLAMRSRSEGITAPDRLGSCGFIAGALVAEYLRKRMAPR